MALSYEGVVSVLDPSVLAPSRPDPAAVAARCVAVAAHGPSLGGTFSERVRVAGPGRHRGKFLPWVTQDQVGEVYCWQRGFAAKPMRGALQDAGTGICVTSAGLGAKGGIAASTAGNVYVWAATNSAALVDFFSSRKACVEAVWGSNYALYATVSRRRTAGGLNAPAEILVVGSLTNLPRGRWLSRPVVLRDGLDRQVACCELEAQCGDV